MITAQNDILLELHVDDFNKVKDFYGKIGFEVAWEEKSDNASGYLVMRRINSILCFWPGNKEVYNQPYFKRFPKNTVRGYGMEVVIMVEDIDKTYKGMRKWANIVEELKLQPWGLRDFRTLDPFGYYLRFTSHHDILDPDNAVGAQHG